MFVICENIVEGYRRARAWAWGGKCHWAALTRTNDSPIPVKLGSYIIHYVEAASKYHVGAALTAELVEEQVIGWAPEK